MFSESGSFEALLIIDLNPLIADLRNDPLLFFLGLSPSVVTAEVEVSTLSVDLFLLTSFESRDALPNAEIGILFPESFEEIRVIAVPADDPPTVK